MIKVLHIFPPSLKSRFGGQTITWKYNFSHWNASDVTHYILDCEIGRMKEAGEAFSFAYPGIQKKSTQWERITWIWLLFTNLIQYKGQYDLIHVHVLWWGGLLIGLWAIWNKLPAIYESVLVEADTPGAIRKEKLGGLKVRFLQSYRAILAISDFLAQDYLQHGFSGSQVFTLMNCVDTELFATAEAPEDKDSLRARLGLPQEATILIFVGSVIPRKGVDLLIQAFSEAARDHPDLFLIVVGPKSKEENPSLDEAFVQDLHHTLQERQLAGRVRFLGLIQDRKELADLYRASDIFVFPSRNEGLGNVVIEAMACGLPVITSQLPVLEKVIEDGKNGLFVPIGDAEALQAAIIRLNSERGLARQLGSMAKEYVRSFHDFSHWQAQLVEIYRKLLTPAETR